MHSALQLNPLRRPPQLEIKRGRDYPLSISPRRTRDRFPKVVNHVHYLAWHVGVICTLHSVHSKNGRDKSGQSGQPAVIGLQPSRIFRNDSGQSGQLVPSRPTPSDCKTGKRCITATGRNARISKAYRPVAMCHCGIKYCRKPHSVVHGRCKMLRAIDFCPQHPRRTGGKLKC